MLNRKLVGSLFSLIFFLFACSFFSPSTQVIEVTRIVRETVVVPYISSPGGPVDILPGISLIIPRTGHTATRLYDNRILLVGGCDGADEHYGIVEIFDPASGLLIPAASLHTPRSGHTATLLPDNRVLVVGGYNYQQQWLDDAEVFDPATDTWTIVSPLYSHGVQHTATLLNDGHVLVVGGCIGSGICTERVEIFNPQTNSWSAATPLAAYRASHNAVLLDDGRVLVAGGGGPSGVPTDGDALIYDPTANTWTATGPMVWQGAQSQMLKLLDGRVLVAGGITVSDYPIASPIAQIYDPASNTWMPAASLSQPRYVHNLILLPDGQAMAVGGAHEYDYPVGYPNSHPWLSSSFDRQIEIYDPNLDRWDIAGELPQPVTSAAAAFLPDGSLWLTGGSAGHAVATAWAETWSIKTISHVQAVPTVTPASNDKRNVIMQKEVSYRLQEIHSLLEQEPMTKGVFYRATAAVGSHGVGISYEFKDWELRTLLFELEQVTPIQNQSFIQNIRNWFDDLEQLGPEASFSEDEPTDPQKVQAARDLFHQIEAEWQLYLDKENQ